MFFFFLSLRGLGPTSSSPLQGGKSGNAKTNLKNKKPKTDSCQRGGGGGEEMEDGKGIRQRIYVHDPRTRTTNTKQQTEV